MKPRPSPATLEFGLIAWLEMTRIALPLKGVECRFDVTGPVACVQLDQIYHQSALQPLDCTYTFPLPAGAAVYRCELHINDRVIRAKVEEKEAARKTYAERKAAGHRTALVETERENLFTLSLGNVQPDDVIVVRFAWFQSLDRVADDLRLLVPTCPGVRYIPGKPLLRSSTGLGTIDDTDQVPDASRITPPRIDALHPDAAYFSLEGRLSTTAVASSSISSPSHPIYVREITDVAKVTVSDGAIPDRDFVLSWREPQSTRLAAQAWRYVESGQAYALAQLRAPADVQVAKDFAQDFYFLVDRSGSMQGIKWQRTCEALQAFVALLGSEDRVWITLFESGFQDFAEAPMSAPEVLQNAGFHRMQHMGTGGGTELLPAAKHVLDVIDQHSPERRTAVVLITDGQVGNENEVLQAFKKARATTVHTFGIDTAVNDAFIKSLARQQRGGCWLQTPNDDIAGCIAGLGDRLRRPVLTNVSIRGAWTAASELAPDLHAREVVNVALRGSESENLEAVGRLPDGSKLSLPLELHASQNEAIKLLWARERITALLDANQNQEAIALAKEHNLICEGAAFVAWDEAERVPVAQEGIVQPAVGAFVGGTALCDVSADYFCAPVSARPSQKRRERLFADLASPGDSLDQLKQHRPSQSTILALQKWRHKAGGNSDAVLQDTALCFIEAAAVSPSDAVRTALEKSLLEALSMPLEELRKWNLGVMRTLRFVDNLDSDIPAPAMARIAAWLLENYKLLESRRNAVRAFLRNMPFSKSVSEAWDSFIATLGATAKPQASTTNP